MFKSHIQTHKYNKKMSKMLNLRYFKNNKLKIIIKIQMNKIISTPITQSKSIKNISNNKNKCKMFLILIKMNYKTQRSKKLMS